MWVGNDGGCSLLGISPYFLHIARYCISAVCECEFLSMCLMIILLINLRYVL